MYKTVYGNSPLSARRRIDAIPPTAAVALPIHAVDAALRNASTAAAAALSTRAVVANVQPLWQKTVGSKPFLQLQPLRRCCSSHSLRNAVIQRRRTLGAAECWQQLEEAQPRGWRQLRKGLHLFVLLFP